MKSSREQFEEWFDEYTSNEPGRCKILRSGIGYRNIACQEQWDAWQASRAALKIDNTPAYWMTFYPCEPGEEERKHSHSGPESCARRIASEIGGYVIPVYYGEKS